MPATRALRLKLWAKRDPRPRTDETAAKILVGLVSCDEHAQAMCDECKPVDETKRQIEVAMLRGGLELPDWPGLVLDTVPIEEARGTFRELNEAPASKIITQGPLH